jgi:multiple sugar transport system ATP-binding protein
VQMRAQLAQLHDRLQTTTVYVTHDQVEAMTLGERVAVLRDGVLQQVDTPQSLYNHPANLFVAAFMGSPPMNLVEARVAAGKVSFANFQLPLASAHTLSNYEGRSVILGIRPADLEDTAVRPNESLPSIEVSADVTEELGSEINVLFMIDAPPVATEELMAAADAPDAEPIVLLGDSPRATFCARVDARSSVRPGSKIRLSVDPARFHFFDTRTGLAVSDDAAAMATA